MSSFISAPAPSWRAPSPSWRRSSSRSGVAPGLTDAPTGRRWGPVPVRAEGRACPRLRRWPMVEDDRAPQAPSGDATDRPPGPVAGQPSATSHRGGFGELGGQAGGLIERTFRERIVLVGVAVAPTSPREVEGSLDELAQLVDTAGADAVARVVQRRQAPDPATYVGRGKAEEVRVLSEAVDSDTVVFDDE